MTNLKMRLLAASLDLRAIREACGISAVRVAAACGVQLSAVWKLEHRAIAPSGPRGAAYMRIVAGMLNHLEADAGEPCQEEAA